jgi:hypothetical protein
MIGGLASAVAWVPDFGMLAVPVALAGAVVGFVGIVIGRMAGQRRVFLPLGGMLLCGVSILVSYGSTIAWKNRPGAPGHVSTPNPPPAVDMRGSRGPFAPALSPVTQPTFVIPKIERPAATMPTTPTTDAKHDGSDE